MLATRLARVQHSVFVPDGALPIAVENPDAVNSGVLWVDVDGERMPEHVISLHDDGGQHSVLVRLGDLARTSSDGVAAGSTAGEA